MKLKLTSAEFNALLVLLTAICTGLIPKGIQQQVVHGTLFRAYKKFYIKAIKERKEYKITLDADEACAFYMFFTRFDMKEQDLFLINLVTKLNNKIHQTYSA